MNNAATLAGHGKALFSSVREAIVFSSRCGNQGKAKKKSLFPENATVVATTAQGGSKKRCFSNAFGYGLVASEVLQSLLHFYLSIGLTQMGDNTF